VIEIDDVRAAAARLAGVANRTRVITSRTLDGRTGGQLFLKAECEQRAGAFKFRGAYNRISTLGSDALSRGVCAFSSGNHAQAVALAARLVGTRATIVMPEDTPEVKLEATRGYGAEVVFYDRYTEDREEVGRALAEERGMTLVPPYEDDHVMAGQGTTALELFEDVGELDLLLVCVGGGGLIAGCATAAKGASPRTRVLGVEPAVRDVTKRSLAAGERIRIPVPQTIADGQQGDIPGAMTFEVNRRRVDGMLLVTDDEILATMRTLFDRCKVVVEPSGAAALAAVLAGHVDVAGKRVGVTLSGGNVGLTRFLELMTDAPAELPALV
jgi:threo-3-hydroxy-L-aspartate ammonia-lyase